ncbi:MAG: site-specific integrase [Planctomycetes bacterium]|nr:site-specific integrase [Planctomycetota bacterium]
MKDKDGTRVYVAKKSTKRGFQYSLRWEDPITGKWRSKSARTTDSRKARHEAARLERELDTGLYRDVHRTDWATFAEQDAARLAGQANRAQTRCILKEFGEACRPGRPDLVTYGMAERYVDHCRSRGNHPATINKKIAALKASFNRAVKREITPRNPLLGWRFERVELKPPRIITEAEESALLAAAEELYGFGVRTFLLALLRTGGRYNEVRQLTWDRIDFDRREVTFTETKGKRARTVPAACSTFWAALGELTQVGQFLGISGFFRG